MFEKRLAKLAAAIVIIVMVLFAGLRHYSNWTDGYSYYKFFNNISSNRHDFEYGFQIWNQLCKWVFHDYNLYLCVTYLCVFILYYKCLAVLVPGMEVYSLFVLFSIYYLASGGSRQYIATSICFFSIQYWLKKDRIKFAVCVLAAVMFHRTAIIFILLLAVDPKKELNIRYVVTILASAYLMRVFAFFERMLSVVYNTGLWEGVHYRIAYYFQSAEYSTLFSFGSMKRFLLLFLFLHCNKHLLKQSKDNLCYVNALKGCLWIYVIGIAFYILVLSDFYRLNIYFYVAEIVLESCTLKLTRKASDKCALLTAYVALNAFIYIYNLNNGYVELFFPYKFCFGNT